MSSHFSFPAAITRILALLLFSLMATTTMADRIFWHSNLTVSDRNFILTGDNMNPARDGIEVTSAAFIAVTENDIEIANYRFVWQLEKENPDGSWSAVILKGGSEILRSDSEVLALDSRPDGSDNPSSAILNHSGKLTPQNQLDPYARHRIMAKLERLPFLGTWHFVGETRTSTPRRYHHFTNTSSSDTPRNVIATLNSVTVTDPFVLDDAQIEDDRSFEVEVNTTARRWDGYLSGRTSLSIPFRYQIELRHPDTNTLVPVKQPDQISETIFSYDLDGSTRIPSTKTFTQRFRVQPLQQLDPRKQYKLKVTVQHRETASTWKTGNAITRDNRLYHFNGSLNFSGIETKMSWFFRRLPASATHYSGFVQTTLERAMGTLTSDPSWKWDSILPAPASTLVVRLYPDGTAQVYSIDEPVLVMPSGGGSGAKHGETSGIRHVVAMGLLDGTGMKGLVAMPLPQGISMAGSHNTRRSEGALQFIVNVNNDFGLTDQTATFDVGQNFYLIEETKPIGIEATSVTWDIPAGKLEFPLTGSVKYLREQEVSYLRNVSNIDPDQQYKKDNSGYYASIDGISGNSLTVTANSNGSAQFDADFTLSNGSFVTHFPYGSEIVHEAGTINIENNIITGGSLTGVDPFYLVYLQSCLNGDCAGGRLNAGGFGLDIPELIFTPDGGFTGYGELFPILQNSGTKLEWGLITSMRGPHGSLFAHSLDSFTSGVFHATGHFIPGTGGEEVDFQPNGTAAKASNNGPANIHLAAITSSLELARPGSAEDISGEFDYAGLNLRVSEEDEVAAEARITGKTAAYSPRECSKFYVRLSGVTGKLEAEPGTFPPMLELADYEVDISYYGLGFINNETSTDRSFVTGEISIGGPTNETFEFDGLSFTCLGGLDEMRLPQGGFSKKLAYWNADLDVHAFRFTSSNSCDPNASTFATLGVTAFSTFIGEPLHGTIGIKPDGTLITHQFSIDEGLETLITSRLRLPNIVHLTGPAEEVYEITPVSEAYFNDFETATSPANGDGRLNFAAKMKVPFFEALNTHIRSTASRNTDPDSVVHLAGGWKVNGDETFFNSKFFDPDNQAYPAASTENIYFNIGGAAQNDQYLVRAQKKWLNVVPFDYPLTWSTTLRSFEAYQPARGTDLLIVKIDHQLEYLSAENAEITFGAVYQGMPEINVTNFVFNKIDEGTGVLQAMTESLQEEAVGALKNGLDAFDNLLNDRIDGMIDDFLKDTVDEIIDDFYQALETASETVDSVNNWKTAVVQEAKDHITGTVDDYEGTLRDAIEKMNGNVAKASSFIHKIDSSLRDVQLGLRVIYGEVYRVEGGVSLDPPPSGADVINGLLTTNSSGDFQIVEALVHRLIAEFAGDIAGEVGAILDNILQESTAELNRIINEQIDKARPALERVKVVIETLDTKIQLVRNQLQVGGEFIAEVESILDSAKAQVETAANQIRDAVAGFIIADIPSPDQFIEISEEELKARIRQEISDKISELEFIRQYQLAIRQRLADIDLAVKEAIDTAFGQVNLAIKNLVGEYLMLVDDKINGFLGDLGSSLGAGELNGFAHIRGDALKLLRLDAYLQLLVPDELEFNGYLQIKQLNSDGSGSCSAGSATSVVNEVTMGALGVPVEWISPGMHIDVEGKVSFTTEPSFKPVGLGGSFEMVDGEIGFEMFTITELGAAMSFGLTENYLAAKAGLVFQSYEVYGGIFFGQTCSIAPLELVSPQAASVLGEPNPTFTGAYIYGEAHIPVSEVLLGIPASCMFKITAGVGVGAFYFVEGPTYGGQMLLGASGEALCLVSIKGDVSLVGVKVADDFRFSGRGRLQGRVGSCPFCIKFGKTLNLEYRNDRWKFSL